MRACSGISNAPGTSNTDTWAVALVSLAISATKPPRHSSTMSACQRAWTNATDRFSGGIWELSFMGLVLQSPRRESGRTNEKGGREPAAHSAPSFSLVRTFTVGSGITPDLLSPPAEPEGARGLGRLG